MHLNCIARLMKIEPSSFELKNSYSLLNNTEIITFELSESNTFSSLINTSDNVTLQGWCIQTNNAHRF
jgi:hypothetical protein